MLRFVVGLIAALVCTSVWAEDAPSLTLNALRDVINKLAEENGTRALESFSIVVAPEIAAPLNGTIGYVIEPEGGRIRIGPFPLTVELCSDSSPPPKYLKDLGFYMMQFCQGSGNLVNVDFHKLANASGDLGAFIGSDTLNCNVRSDYLTMTPKVRKDFCNEN